MAVLYGILTTLAAIACASVGPTRLVPEPPPPEPTPQPRPLSLPQDDSAHDSPIEWWYYNGHLSDTQGNQFAFHYVIFRSIADIQNPRPFAYAQMGIIDIDNLKHRHHRSPTISRLETSDNPTSDSDDLLHLDLDRFKLTIDKDGNHHLIGRSEEKRDSLDLQLNASQNIMLHEGIGWMDWPFGSTYYYSYPRMKTQGSLTLDGERRDVSGEVWFDHQWGDFFVVGKPAGWQWFALHMNDGASIMISEVRGVEGAILSIDGTLTSQDGEQQILDAEEHHIEIREEDTWTSPHTGGTYPSKWTISISKPELEIAVQPVILDQEIPPIPLGNSAAAYWEGRVDVIDPNSGEKIGKGYVELSGYVDPQPLQWRETTD